MWIGAACAGPAATARCSVGDNLAIHLAVAAMEPGQVLVATMPPDVECGAWGEILTVAAQARGAAGLIFTQRVRDVDAIARRGFPVHARGTALPSASKVDRGSIGGAVDLGGVTVRPGDLVVADVDGVVAFPESSAPTVLAAAEARFEDEERLMQLLERGSTTVELLGLEEAGA